MVRFRRRTLQQQQQQHYPNGIGVVVIVITAVSNIVVVHHSKLVLILICVIIVVVIRTSTIVQQQQLIWNDDQLRLSSMLSLPVVAVLIYQDDTNDKDDSIPNTKITTTTADANSSDLLTYDKCFVHEPIYVTNVIRNPRRHNKKSSNKNNDTDTTASSKEDSSNKDGAYLIHPNPKQCGTLRRTIWKTGYTILYESTSTSTVTPTNSTSSPSNHIINIAYEIEQRQSNCSLPLQMFHLDNQNGLGAHLHLWSQAYCNNNNNNNTMGTAATTTTSTQYRIKTYNPHWLWRDQMYCSSIHQHHRPMASPWTCYFPKMEDRCPNDNVITNHKRRTAPLLHPDINRDDNVDHYDDYFRDIPNVTSPYNNNDRCRSLQWPNTKKNRNNKRDRHSNSEPNTEEEENNNNDTAAEAAIALTTRSISKYISEYRAATTEYIFQSIHPMIVQEAERQIGLLFESSSSNNNINHNNNNNYEDKTTTTPTTSSMVPLDMITVHLRWGDKFFEMDLVSIEEYVQAIVDMLQIIHDNNNDKSDPEYDRQQQANANPIDNTTAAHIYLASEDPNAVSEFLQYTQLYYPNWNIYIDRTITELHQFRPNVGNRASWTTKNTKGRAGLIALGSLLVGMESKYYILTTGSNWSRIMNELRTNVIHKRCCINNSKNCTHMIDLRPGEW